MSHSIVEDIIYPRLPILLQNAACGYYGWRENRIRSGDFYKQRLDSLMASEFAEKNTISEYQDRQIAELIKHVSGSVPYYQKLFAEYGLRASDIVSRSDLSKIPILTRAAVIKNYDEMFSSKFPRERTIPRATSGTTGTALRFASTKESVAFQRAVWSRFMRRFGVDPEGWHINFTGKAVVATDQRHPPFWRLSRPTRQFIVPMNQIVPSKIAAIVEFLNATSVEYFTGYPSIISALALLIQENGLKVNTSPKVIFLGAEPTLEWQKDIMEKVFNARVTDQYGTSEGCGNASRCECGNYHEDWEFGVLECVGPEPLDGNAVQGKIVATGFSNYAFPLIRYEIGDVGHWYSDRFVCSCGRSSRAMKGIDGRSEDFVLTPEGARIARFDYLFKGSAGIAEAQVVQRELGSIVIRYVPRAGELSDAEINEIKATAAKLISPKLQVSFEKVNVIERTRSGKFRAVVSAMQSASA